MNLMWLFKRRRLKIELESSHWSDISANQVRATGCPLGLSPSPSQGSTLLFLHRPIMPPCPSQLELVFRLSTFEDCFSLSCHVPFDTLLRPDKVAASEAKNISFF